MQIPRLAVVRTADSGSLGMTSVIADVRACIDHRGTETAQAPSLREGISLRLDLLIAEPLAVRRRVVRAAFERASGKTLDFEHTDELVRFLERRESSLLQLPERWFAVLDWPRRVVRFEERAAMAGTRAGKFPSKSMSRKGGKVAGRKV